MPTALAGVAVTLGMEADAMTFIAIAGAAIVFAGVAKLPDAVSFVEILVAAGTARSVGRLNCAAGAGIDVTCFA
jgi:hypothetical protein